MGCKVRIAGTVNDSIVDGPGLRYTIFFQGCTHNCPKCHNPQTHDLNGGYIKDADELIEDMIKNPLLDGITLSGGDPFLQIDSLIYLSKATKEHNMNVIAYTGFIWEDIIKDAELKRGLQYIDYIIDGPFIYKLKSLNLLFRGSSNQRIIDVQKSLSEGTIVLADFKTLQ